MQHRFQQSLLQLTFGYAATEPASLEEQSSNSRRHGKKRVWVVQYYDAEGHHRYHTLGLQQVFLPFYRGKWKGSTKGTSENRIQFHIVGELGNSQIETLTPSVLQAFLDRKAASSSFSVVDHLRWDLSSICELAVAEKVIPTNPATALYTPKNAQKGACPVMTADEAEAAVGAVEFRERVIFHLAIFAGLRPGEMLALQRRHVAQDRSSVEVQQRVYRGEIDDPKNRKARTVAIPPRTATQLSEWLDTAVDPAPEAWVFASENKVGLAWVDFKVVRRTNASLGQDANVDPKVSADQRGHGIGVSLDVYTKTSIQKKAEGAQQLEGAVLGRKVVPIREKVAS